MTMENKGAFAATIVVAANDSLGYRSANYVCPGAADDVEINAALAAGAGGKVILLEGNYQITANLTVPANTHFSGMGKGTILTTTDAIGITNMVILNGDNITVSDMKLVLGAGAGDAGSRPNVIYATGRTLIWLENLWIYGDQTVNDANDARQNGVYFDTVTDSKIITCRIENNGRHGINLSDASNNNTLTGNTCQGNAQTGIYQTTSDNNTLTGNTCQGNAQTGIYLTTSDNNTLTGNTCQGNTQTGIYLATSNNNTLTGNTCQGNTQYGIILATSNNNTLTGNTCQGNTREGIFLTTSDNNTLTGNTCADNDSGGNTRSGIYISNSNENVITGNQCSANGLHGIYILESSYCVVTGNVCNNQNTGDGIHVRGDAPNADYNTLTGNVCTGNADDGIEISEVAPGDANKNIVSSNQLLGNGGLALNDGGTNTQIGLNVTI